MTIPSYSPEAFAARVSMSRRIRLFLVVEGIETDSWFYDEVCRQSRLLKPGQHEIFPVRLVTRGLKCTGGKKRVVELFEYMERQGIIGNGKPPARSALMLCVDADHDRIAGGIRRAKNLTYTKLPDVEAHVFDDFDIEGFIRRAYSTTAIEARVVVASLHEWREQIARTWRPWFEICLAAHYCGIRRPSLGTPPRLLPDGKVDEATTRGVRDAIIEKVGIVQYEEAARKANGRIGQFYSRRQEVALLKGKWLSAQLLSAANEEADRLGLSKLGNKEALFEAVKGSAQFSRRTTRYYLDRFETLIE
ncbi:hypothetical protein ABZ412_13750 [Nocardia sp. NPDC005746]|uniref:hypothetical protein n=1 Tax=Nocardia sp. NPDC005746 TaxID=3157062 RepID=UPI0033CA6E7B